MVRRLFLAFFWSVMTGLYIAVIGVGVHLLFLVARGQAAHRGIVGYGAAFLVTGWTAIMLWLVVPPLMRAVRGER